MTTNLQKYLKQFGVLLTAVFLAAFLTACDDGNAENAGEKVDDAASEMKDSMKDAGNAIEDACEDVKDAADAEDKDC